MWTSAFKTYLSPAAIAVLSLIIAAACANEDEALTATSPTPSPGLTATAAPTTSPTPTPTPIPPASPTPSGALPFAPTASQIAYVAPTGAIWLINADGSGNQQIVPEAAMQLRQQALQDARDAVWSPDGWRIAYIDVRRDPRDPMTPDLGGDLWVWDGTTGEHRLIDDNAGHPSWVAGGRYLSYLKYTPNPESDHPASDTWVADVTLGDAKWSVGTSGCAWSPDGSWCAYEVGRPPECDGECYHRATLFLVSLDGSQRRELTDDGTFFGGPGWSPDGRFLAYWKNEHGGSAMVGDIYAMDLTTGAEIRLGEFTSDEFPRWAPSEDALIFHNLRIDPETDETTELFERPGAIVAWSPDATKVAYVQGRPFGSGPRSLVVLDLDNEQRTVFHTSQADIPHAGSPGYGGNWSPNGRYFAFVGQEEDRAEASLYIADTTTSTASAVIKGLVFGSYSPAGDHLLVQQSEALPPPSVMPSPTPLGTPMSHTIWIADPDGSHLTKIADGTPITGPQSGWRPAPK